MSDMPEHKVPEKQVTARANEALREALVRKGDDVVKLNGKEYRALLVEKGSADWFAALVGLLDHLAKDVVTLTEANYAQADLMKQQALEMEALRARVTQLESQRLVTSALQELQRDITSKGEVHNYDATFKFSSEAFEDSTGSQKMQQDGDSSQRSTTDIAASIGKVYDWLAGAQLAAKREKFSKENFAKEVTERWAVVRKSKDQIFAKVTIGKFVPKAPTQHPAAQSDVDPKRGSST